MDINYGSDLIFSAKRDSVPRETLQTMLKQSIGQLTGAVVLGITIFW